jgi:hypothetical protein
MGQTLYILTRQWGMAAGAWPARINSLAGRSELEFWLVRNRRRFHHCCDPKGFAAQDEVHEKEEPAW